MRFGNPLRRDGHPLLHPRDPGRTLAIAAGYALAGVVPQRLDAWIAGRIAGVALAARPGSARWLAERMGEMLGSAAGDRDLRALARDHYRMRAENAWARIRLLHGAEWRASATLEGLQHLQAASQAGNGAILWRMRFCDAPIADVACAQAGFPLTHLSHVAHGAHSITWLAMAVNARLYRKAEERYLRERVLIPFGNSVGYLKVMIDRLSSNETVSIFGELRDRQSVAAPLFGRSLQFANGAPSLAWKTGAALLTMHAVREGPYRYRVVIEEPVAADRSLPRKEYVRLAVQEFTRRLEQRVIAHPAEWMGWYGEHWTTLPASLQSVVGS